MGMGDFWGDIVNDVKDFFEDDDIKLAKTTAGDVQTLLGNPNDADAQNRFAAEVNQMRAEAGKHGDFEYYNKMNTEFQKLESMGFPTISMMGDGGITAMPKRDPSTYAPEGALKIEDSHDTYFKLSASVVDHSDKGQYGWKKLY